MTLCLTVAASTALLVAPPQEPAQLSLDESCRTALEALQANDVALLEAVFPTPAEVETLFEMQASAESPEALAAARKKFEEDGGAKGVLDAMSKRMAGRIEATRTETAEHFEIESAKYLFARPPAEPLQRVGPWDVAPVEFYVWADGRIWSFGARDVIQTSRGWAYTEFLSFKGERDIVEPGRVDESERLKMEDAAREREVERDRMEMELAELRTQMRSDSDAHTAELEHLRMQLQEAEHERRRGAASESEFVAALRAENARLVDGVDERIGVLQGDLRRAELDNIGRAMAVERLEAKLATVEMAPVDPGALSISYDWSSIEWWDRTEGLPEGEKPAPPSSFVDVVRRLSEPLTLDLTDVTHEEALRVISLATGAPIFVMPGTFDLVDEPVISFDGATMKADEMVEAVLNSCDSHPSIFDGQVILASPESIELFRAWSLGGPALATSTATGSERKLRSVRRSFSFAPDTARSILQLIADAGEVNVWVMQDAPMGEPLVEHDFESESELSLWTLLMLITSEASLSVEALEDVVLVSGELFHPPGRQELPDELARRTKDIAFTGSHESMPLARLLELVSAEIGFELEASDDVLALPMAQSFHGITVHELPLATLLQLISIDLGEETEWTATPNGAILVKP